MQQETSPTQPVNTLGLSFSQLRAMSRQELSAALASVGREGGRKAVVRLLNDLLKIGRYMEVLAASMADSLNAQVGQTD